MEFSAATIALLRDEAYVYLCREVVQEKLTALEAEKAEIESTRSPFGVFARKSTRDAFTRSMRTALDSETSLRDRLAQVVRLDGWLQPLIRRDIISYLETVSAEYLCFPQIQQFLTHWERGLHALPDKLTAFTRDMRVVREAAEAGRRPAASDLVVLREIATRVEDHFVDLAQCGLAIAEHAQQVLALEELSVPTLPNLQRVAWVDRLSVLPIGEVATEVARVEFELRAFLNGGVEAAIARLHATGEVCTSLQEAFLQNYWNQLRTHARIHYVEECDLDDVLATLGQRYGDAIDQHHRSVATHNPFLAER